MKRNENLLIFSHEHHHGLIFCSRLLKAKNASEAVLLEYILDFWDNYLDEHFINEEKLFLPLLDDEELTARFLYEHKQINELVSKIKSSTEDLHLDALELSKLINDHIRFEERIFFPWLEDKFTLEELSVVGKELEEIEITEHRFSDEFWK